MPAFSKPRDSLPRQTSKVAKFTPVVPRLFYPWRWVFLIKKIVLPSIVIGLLLCATTALFAQTATPPPKVIRIYREEVKPGMTAAHRKLEVPFPRAFTRANGSNHYIGLTSISGPNEAWFIEPHESFAEIEKFDQEDAKNTALSAEIDQLLEHDGSVLSGSRAILARLEEDLSFRPGFNMAMMRFVSVNTVRVRPGHDAEFRESRKIINAAYEKANADQHLAIFQVTAGAPTGTYLIFRGRKSLAELDAPPNQLVQQALGESNQKKLQELQGSALISNEANIFSIKPDMSYAPKAFATADPAFWAPKAAVAKRPVAKKPPVKTETGQ